MKNDTTLVAILQDSGKETFRKTLQEAVNRQLQEEMKECLRRTWQAGNRRCGHYKRKLQTEYGVLHLLIPRDRKGEFTTMLFDKWQRKSLSLIQWIRERIEDGATFLKTCQRLAKQGIEMSPATIGRTIDKPQLSPVETECPFVILDAIHFRRTRVLLIALGIRLDGSRVILAMKEADKETTGAYAELFQEMVPKGGDPLTVRLVSIDGLIGLDEVVVRYFPLAIVQRCRFHFFKNLLKKLSPLEKKAVKADVSLLFSMRTVRRAMLVMKIFSRKYARHPVLQKAFDYLPELFTVLSLPKPIQICFRTTNWLERLNSEVRQALRRRKTPRFALAMQWILVGAKRVYEASFDKPNERFTNHKEKLLLWMKEPPPLQTAHL